MEDDQVLESPPADPTDRIASEKQLEEKYPNRPHNHSPSLPFHSLFQDLFNPLNENKKKPTGPFANRRRLGPDGGPSENPHTRRRSIIERFISKWRREVGYDIFPAFRLIIPEKDRDRAMYGLKEKVLGRFLVKIMKIDKNSEDGFNLLNWKLPGQSTASRMAGDFAGRCYEVISKRPFRTEVGHMTIDEVNEQLDHLSTASRDEEQLPILTDFYKRMNAEELMWLIRIILRQMKVGATEKTFLNIWHPDAESLFNVSSSLRRVCWELYDVTVRLDNENRGVALMQCFQPQLAQFQMRDFKKIVERLRPTEDDQEFWIEDKLDGERIQLHMISDDNMAGGKRFKFWSRKAKEYSYLYGEGLQDPNSALTQHLKSGFSKGVENIILDGEMITWDPEVGKIVAFGTLKSAALSEQKNPFAGGHRPLFRVFDILLLNDRPLTRYTLRDRRKALEASIIPIHHRFELHDYKIGTTVDDIEPCLRKIVEQAAEGLVLKNPRSAYKLNERNDDWMKVKPEYMSEFGESLDCLVIGGYYGSGKRGGGLSSFLCGLRADKSQHKTGDGPHKFISFFRVGGGFSADDYASIRHHTDGKWVDWDTKKPPTDYIEIADGRQQALLPNVWIKPTDSVVVEVKAASLIPSDEYAAGFTLRFPRFKRLRQDKNCESALSHQELLDLKARMEKDQKEKDFKVDDERRKRRKLNTHKKPLIVVGYTAKDTYGIQNAQFSSQVFAGLTFYVMTESFTPVRKTKVELEELIKSHGGDIVQTNSAVANTVCIAERQTVKVASLRKKRETPIVKATWLFDCIKQAEFDFSKGLPELTVPIELDRHIYFMPPDLRYRYVDHVDDYGDSYARDTNNDELRETMAKMNLPESRKDHRPTEVILEGLKDESLRGLPGWLFLGTKMCFHATAPGLEMSIISAQSIAAFAGAQIADDLSNTSVTHVVLPPSVNGHNAALESLRKQITSRTRLPRFVTCDWILQCWKDGTMLDEERFTP